MSSPYIGNDAFPSAATIPSDSDTPQTANLMPPVESALDRGFFNWRRAQSSIALNWSPLFQVDASTRPTLTCLGWSPLDRQWLAGVDNAAHTACGVWINTDLDGTLGTNAWTEVGGGDIVVSAPNVFVADVLGDPNNAATYLAIILVKGTAFDIYRWHSGSWNVVYSVASTNRSNGRVLYFTEGLAYVALVASSTASQCGITVSADGVTWSDVAASYGGAIGITNPITAAWSWAQSATSMIAVPQQPTGSSDQKFWKGTGNTPVTWTRNAFTAGTVSGSDAPYAVAYCNTINATTGATQGTYVCAVHLTGGGGTKILQSVDDGVTWTVAATITSRVITNLAALGFLLIAGCEESSGGVDHTIFSLDGGLTWHPTQATDTNVGSAPQYYQEPRLAVSDVGFALNNTAHARFSQQWGIPAAIS